MHGRVIRIYVGAGERGEQAALQDRLRRDAQAEEKMRARQQRARYLHADKALAAYCQQVEACLRAALVAEGYQQHDRGEWRRIRGSTRRC
jgi:hypothetical protein